MLQKIIYKLGVKWRNPSLLRQFESLKKSDKWSIEKLQAYQFERLKALLQFAYDHSPFYKKGIRRGRVPSLANDEPGRHEGTARH